MNTALFRFNRLFWVILMVHGTVVFPGSTCATDLFTEEIVLRLITATAEAIQDDAPGTFSRINAGEHPYQNSDNPALYVFVYDTEVNIVAHHDSALVGKNFKSMGDVLGKLFHQEIVAGAIRDGHGHTIYAWKKPGLKKGRRYKKTHYRLVTGSNDKKYVVCAGIYIGLRKH